MTKINKAFIKAYRQDQPQTSPATPVLAGAAPAARGSHDPAGVVRGSPDPALKSTEGLPRQRTSAGHSTMTGVATTNAPMQASNAAAGDLRSETVRGQETRAQRAKAPSPCPLPKGEGFEASPRSAIYGPRVEAAQKTAAPPRTEKQPLSAFIGQSNVRPISDQPQSDFLKPGTTVASFAWPKVCRRLAQHCGGELERLAASLIAEAAAGRSLIAVVGLASGAGTTTTALCLASRIAARGKRVILVDGNFTKPILAATLDAEPTSGWQDVLSRGAPLADAVIRATDDRLDLLALSARPPADPLKIVSGLQAVVTAGVLRHAYDVVLVDAGAISDRVAQPIIFEMVRNLGVDATVAVAGPSGADTRDLADLAEHLSRSGCELLGTIENRSRV